jgi:predicted Fe-Mo cluster-binding NifX family protein
MPTKLIINCETGEQTEVELTAEEIAQREADAAKAEADKVAKEAADAVKAEAKAELLARLGLTAEEAALLVS